MQEMLFTNEMYETYKIIDGLNLEQRKEFFERIAETIGPEKAKTLNIFYVSVACIDWRQSETGKRIREYIGIELYRKLNEGK